MYYIGMHSTNKLDDGYVGSGKRLWYSIRKYGIENFKCEILEFLPDRDSLAKRERELVNEETLLDTKCLNLKKGGHGGFNSESAKRGREATDQILRDKYGDDFKRIITKKYHENLSADERNVMREKIRSRLKAVGFDHGTFRGKKHTEETKLKMSKSSKGTGLGNTNSQFGTCWITNEVESRKIKKYDNIPSGWRYGRKLNISTVSVVGGV